MHGINAGALGHIEQLVDVEVGLLAGGAVQAIGRVGQADVQRIGIVVGIDGHRFELGVAGRAGDAYGDLAAIGDQHFLHDDSSAAAAPPGWSSMGASVSGSTATKRIASPGATWAAMGRSSAITTAMTG